MVPCVASLASLRLGEYCGDVPIHELIHLGAAGELLYECGKLCMGGYDEGFPSGKEVFFEGCVVDVDVGYLAVSQVEHAKKL